MDDIRLTQLVHAMVVGGTGSGKTQSVIMPMSRSMLRLSWPGAGGDKRMGMLMVDPKRELLEATIRQLTAQDELDRLVHIGGSRPWPPVRYFDVNDGLSCRDKLKRLEEVSGVKGLAAGHHAYWQQTALEMLGHLLEQERTYRERSGRSLYRETALQLGLPVDSTGFWAHLLQVLKLGQNGRSSFNRIVQVVDGLMLPYRPDDGEHTTFLSSFEGGSDLDQFHYRVQAAEMLLDCLTDEKVAAAIDFDPFPSAPAGHLDVRVLLDQGKVLLFQPDACASGDVIARALKAKVHEAAKSRSDMERPIGIVVDEYQRFISSDQESGDATFLDTARAYRVTCVLATQSIGALVLALGADARAEAAVSAIVANTPSKWCFMSKDEKTASAFAHLIPSLAGQPHLLTVRPLAQLQAGQACWTLADGRWGLNRCELDRLV